MKYAPMIVSGSTEYLPSWGMPLPNSTNVAHIISLYSYNFTNGQSSVTYDDTANDVYAGNSSMGPTSTTVDNLFLSMNRCANTGCGDKDVDVW